MHKGAVWHFKMRWFYIKDSYFEEYVDFYLQIDSSRLKVYEQHELGVDLFLLLKE
jgi:hypothetical protein